MNAQPVTIPPPRSLRALLEGLAKVGAREERGINGLSLDSRRVNAHDLFIAVPGGTRDGRDYIRDAVRSGAVAVAREKRCDGRRRQHAHQPHAHQPHERQQHQHQPHEHPHACGVPSFDIAGLDKHIGTIAARFFEHPSARMQLIGITGTNGKTTCAWLIARALDLLGRRCALMSTVGTGFAGALQPSPLTTADAISTHRTLASLLARKAAAVCVEVSSHGLEQGRVNRVEFDVAVLTNLSRDHLDYHGSMAHYGRAKQKLFQFDSLQSAVINADDRFGQQLLDHMTGRGRGAVRCLGYGIDGGDLRARNVELNENGIAFDAHWRGQSAQIRSTLLGAVNVPNVLAAIATLLCCGYDLGQIAATAGKWRPPPGRMELLRKSRSQPAVIVDYAHTPDALKRALQSLAELCRGKLWVVFGCGGDRDHGKRPLMGRVAERFADRVVITDDNPRTEKPEEIAAQIAAGMKTAAAVLHDRRRAIETAIAAATAEDIVLVAGKGHETTQVRGRRAVELSDRDIVAAAQEGRS